MQLNIYLQSSNNITLFNYKNKIENVFKNYNIHYTIISLPTKTKHYSILRSPHVYKKSIAVSYTHLTLPTKIAV